MSEIATRKAYFYNSNGGDRKYNADSMIDWLAPFFTTGVFNNCFRVVANDVMNVTIEGGYCNIQGRVMHQWDNDILDIPVASGNLSRIDIAVIRRDDISRDIYPLIVSGGFSQNPVKPALVRENGIYDIQLAQWTVKPGVIAIKQVDITDTRMNGALCGWVVGTVPQIDFTQINAQFNAFFSEYKAQITDEYDGYTDQIATQYNAYVALTNVKYAEYMSLINQLQGDGNMNYAALLAWFENFKQQSTDKFNLWYGTNTTQFANDFMGWFANIQGMLSGDVATNLSNAVMALQNKASTLETTDAEIRSGITTLDQRLTGKIEAVETYIENNLWFSTVTYLSNAYLGTTYLSESI